MKNWIAADKWEFEKEARMKKLVSITQTKTIRTILHIKPTTTTMPINAIPTMMSIGIAAIMTKSKWHLFWMHIKLLQKLQPP